MLPQTAILISQQGVITADAGATTDSWQSYLGGVSVTLTALAAVNRPAYSATGGVGGRPLITTDGVDDVLFGTMTKGSAWTSAEIGFVGQRIAFVAAANIHVCYFSLATPAFYLNDASTTQMRLTVSGGSNSNHPTDPDGLNRHWSGDAEGTTQVARINGVSSSPQTITITSRTDGANASIGARTTGLNPSNIAVQAVYLGAALSSGQRDYLRAALTHYTGIDS